jgi:hypothetical protein
MTLNRRSGGFCALPCRELGVVKYCKKYGSPVLYWYWSVVEDAGRPIRPFQDPGQTRPVVWLVPRKPSGWCSDQRCGWTSVGWRGSHANHPSTHHISSTEPYLKVEIAPTRASNGHGIGKRSNSNGKSLGITSTPHLPLSPISNVRQAQPLKPPRILQPALTPATPMPT